MAIKHKKVMGQPDPPDGRVGGAAWDDDHDITGDPHVFSVRSYGATGDGTTDDTAALAAAIAAATAAGKGTVYFPDGVYVISSTLTIANEKITLAGESWAASIYAANTWTTANQPMIVASGALFRMTNLKLDGNRTNRGPVTSAHSIRPTGSDSLIDHCWITGDVWEAIRSTTTVYGLRVEDNLFTFGYGGYVYLQSAIHCSISRNQMSANLTDSPIKLTDTGPTNNLIADNLIIGAFDVGILCSAASPVDNVVSGNRIITTGGAGISFANGVNTLISGNLVKGAGNQGINAGSDATIIGNTLRDCGSATHDGIFCGANTLIVGNWIQGSGRDGVRIDAVAGVIVSGNRIGGSGRLATGREVIVRGTATNITVSDNIFTGGGVSNDWALIVQNSADRVIVSGNQGFGSYANKVLTNTSGNIVKVTNNPSVGPTGVLSVTVTASPFIYTNTDKVTEALYIRGGTVSDVNKNGGGIFTASPATVLLEPGEAVTVTYSSAPTITRDLK